MGALGTARWARRLGRHSVGVPGPVTSSVSACTALLRKEAVLVTDAAEVVELLVGDVGAGAGAAGARAAARSAAAGPRRRGDCLAVLPARGRAASRRSA